MFTDQLGNVISLVSTPQRIVSLVPSQSELLFDLGLDKQIVGVTKFCIHPAKALKEKTIIGGTKKFDFEIIDRLKPDLIIGNKEENYKEGIGQLTKKYPVWMSDIYSLDDSLDMMRKIGRICNRTEEADAIITKIELAFQLIKVKESIRVLYLIWRKPWMAAGRETFISSMIETIGWKNAVEDSRYPEMSERDIERLQPDAILLSSEPYPFKEKHLAELKQLSPSSKIILVYGEMFSWYGSRLIKAPEYFNSINV
jgi:ABC-type Fe3+-hydroxamate transport system substrate-binding protein